MTKQKPFEVVVLLDDSPSMAGIVAGTLEGVNAYFNKQREVPNAFCSLYLFSAFNPIQPKFEGLAADAVPTLTRVDYNARGNGTALHDAIVEVAEKMALRIVGDRRATLLIVTDGEENSSRTHNRGATKAAIERLRARGWEVDFMGANQDAILKAQGFGIAPTSAMVFGNNNAATANAFNASAVKARGYGATGQSMSYTADDRMSATQFDDASRTQALKDIQKMQNGNAGN
jgi:hypothetical protein